jgi:hypothetical protein
MRPLFKYLIHSIAIVSLANPLNAQQGKGNWIYRCNEKLVEIIMEDLFTPPVASRVQLYPNIAAYEVICFKDKTQSPLAGHLNGLSRMDAPSANVDISLASMIAFTTVARRLVYSEYLVDQFQENEISDWKNQNNDTAILAASVNYGKSAADQVIAWMKKDNYDYSRTLTRYIVVDSSGSWQPTAPDYANAVEPNWPVMRSMVFDSSTRVCSAPPLEYSEKKNSPFYNSAMKVYRQSMQADTVKKTIALFWDCNPNITRSAGHFTYFVHKVSPGGHWIRITGQAIKNLGIDEVRSCKTYVLVALSLFEGFLSCWCDKYNYNRVRPETYINKLISPKWKPFIETPPFPEYPSGHSVISGAASTILTAMIPQPYSFTDSSEMYINLAPRKFPSFRAAAEEASVSRFYGGIHFMEALDNGLAQGRKIGEYILQKIR